MTEQKTITAKLDCALAMLSQSVRIPASSRKEITAMLQDVRNEVDLLVSENHTLKTHHIRVEADTVVKSLRGRVEELISLVEQQASYIHNNIKSAAVKATTIYFLSKEQPDASFGVYAVNPEWLKQKLGDQTVTNEHVDRIVREEATVLSQKQIQHSNFQIHIIIKSALSVRFSVRQGGAFQGVNRIMGGGLFPGVLDAGDLAGWLDAARRGGGMF